MSNHKASDEVKFHLDIGLTRADHNKIVTLESLGLSDEDLADMGDVELNNLLEDELQEWANGYINIGYQFK